MNLTTAIAAIRTAYVSVGSAALNAPPNTEIRRLLLLAVAQLECARETLDEAQTEAELIAALESNR